MLVSECLDHRDSFCYGWNNKNYADNECVWKCLTAPIEHVLNDITAICRSDLMTIDIVREICKELKKQWGIPD